MTVAAGEKVLAANQLEILDRFGGYLLGEGLQLGVLVLSLAGKME